MQYDLVVIGSGWAGFNAALRAKELGFKVAVIEKKQLGGTCLNLGCIPTKALIQSAKVYSLSKKAKRFGIEISAPLLNFSEVQKRKELIVGQLRSGISSMLGGIDIFNGQASIVSAGTVEVGGEKLDTRFILIACGSKPYVPEGLISGSKKFITSDEMLELKGLPKSLLIVGGGVVGSEFAGLFSSLGCQVSLVELMPQLLPGLDEEVAKKLEGIFKKKGVKVSTNTDARAARAEDYEIALCCIGRIPDTSRLCLDKLGIRLEKGKIVTDEHLLTSIPNIYAAGDCNGRVMLAHAASYQGILAVENMANPANPRKADRLIPSCIFTDPEISSVGLTEKEARAAGVEVRVDKFDFLGSGMARILDETEGFIKIVSNKKTGQILGSSIIGARATELISTLAVAIQHKLKTAELKRIVFPHPTLAEGIGEALKKSDGV